MLAPVGPEGDSILFPGMRGHTGASHSIISAGMARVTASSEAAMRDGHLFMVWSFADCHMQVCWSIGHANLEHRICQPRAAAEVREATALRT
jgi:hypothetical protein